MHFATRGGNQSLNRCAHLSIFRAKRLANLSRTRRGCVVLGWIEVHFLYLSLDSRRSPTLERLAPLSTLRTQAGMSPDNEQLTLKVLVSLQASERRAVLGIAVTSAPSQAVHGGAGHQRRHFYLPSDPPGTPSRIAGTHNVATRCERWRPGRCWRRWRRYPGRALLSTVPSEGVEHGLAAVCENALRRWHHSAAQVDRSSRQAFLHFTIDIKVSVQLACKENQEDGDAKEQWASKQARHLIPAKEDEDGDDPQGQWPGIRPPALLLKVHCTPDDGL